MRRQRSRLANAVKTTASLGEESSASSGANERVRGIGVAERRPGGRLPCSHCDRAVRSAPRAEAIAGKPVVPTHERGRCVCPASSSRRAATHLGRSLGADPRGRHRRVGEPRSRCSPKPRVQKPDRLPSPSSPRVRAAGNHPPRLSRLPRTIPSDPLSSRTGRLSITNRPRSRHRIAATDAAPSAPPKRSPNHSARRLWRPSATLRCCRSQPWARLLRREGNRRRTPRRASCNDDQGSDVELGARDCICARTARDGSANTSPNHEP